MNFKFSHNKDRFVWEDDTVKVVFSKPSFQPCDEYGYVKSIKSILYNYYTVSIFKKPTIKTKWKLVASKSTFDFPQIVPFIYDLDTILHKDVKAMQDITTLHEDRKDKNYKIYETLLQSSDFLYDDFYSIQRREIVDMVENKKTTFTRFSLYIGCAVDVQGSSTTEGLWIDKLNEADMEELYNCVTGFMEYSIKRFNDRMRKAVKRNLKSFRIVGNKLYKMNGKNVEQVICIGDECDMLLLNGSIDSDDYTSKDYSDYVISDINGNNISIEKEYKKADGSTGIEKYEFSKDVLIDIFRFDMSDEKLHYGVKEIAKDWVNILNEKEKEEFKNGKVDELYVKWCEAIINRTWMCRGEHNLSKITEDKGNHENVYANVKDVIKKVKKLL